MSSLASSIQDDDDLNERTPLVTSTSLPPKHPLGVSLSSLNFYERRVQPCLVEFFGTAVFVFIGTMAAQNELLLANAIAHGLTIALLILSFGNISGGHFNPAVSLGACLAGDKDVRITLAYWLSQLTGSILGAAMTRGCLSYTKQVAWLPPSNATVFAQIQGGTVTLQAPAGVGEGVLTEFALTLLLVTTVIMTAIDTRTKSPTAGLAIGFSVVVSAVAGGYVTEAALNPARALGPAIVATDVFPAAWDNHYIYWVGPMAGASMAGLLYRLFFAAPDKRLILKKSQ